MISTVSCIISITIAVTTKGSSDSDRGRRPETKSDEFSEVPPLVIDISRIHKRLTKVLRLYLIGSTTPMCDVWAMEIAQIYGFMAVSEFGP